MVTRGRCLCGQRLHLPGTEVLAGRNRIRRLLQHQPEQMAADQLRLFHNVGARQDQADVRLGRGSLVPPTRLLGRHHRLSTLGRPLESPLQESEAVVRVEELRHQRPSEVHQASHQAGEAVRGARIEGQTL